MALKYKTRGSSNPQRKPKVYFCGHPEDFKIFFEKISDEILALQDCAIWYDDDEQSIRDQLFYNDLKQMQLFVIPVTTLILTQSCRAVNEDFRFAIENHIPVLPLMQEDGLDAEYRKSFGDLQYLTRIHTDSTEISYDEKLKKYLDSILLDDETIKRVQDAFDAYIFLSYRKKDRIHAQELMRIIHKNEFCRDIAIWYDEFLTPGENFNNSIKAALEKSDIFVLAVTPNLSNEKNYVMTTEYPMAKSIGKPIVPVEMVKTFKPKLWLKFKSKFHCIKPSDEEELSEVLLENVRKISKKENEKNPEHHFFIGLAYLSGIDVEVDYEKAVELITFAGEKGVPEAIDKLIEMYNKGFGVARDFHKAIYWQEKKAELFKKTYEENPNEDNCYEMFWRITKCGDAYKTIVDYKKAVEIYHRALAFAEEHVAKYGATPLIKRTFSVSYVRLGDLASGDEAMDYFTKTLVISEQLAAEVGDYRSRRDLALTYGRFGGIYFEQKDYEKAREYYEKYREISQALIDETNETMSRADFGLSCYKLGDIYRAQGDSQKSKEYYEKSREILEAVAAETNDDMARQHLGASYDRLGLWYLEQKDYEKSKEQYQAYYNICKALMEEQGTVTSRRNFAYSIYRMAELYKVSGDKSSAIQYYKDNYGMRVAIARETELTDDRRSHLASCCLLADVYKDEDVNYSQQLYEEGLAIAKKLFEESCNLDSRCDLSATYARLAAIYKKQGKREQAKEYYKESLQMYIKLHEDTGNNQFLVYMDACYENMAVICEACGDLSEAKELYEKLLEIRKILAEERKTNWAKRDLAANYLALGNIYKQLSQYEEAMAYYEKAFEIRNSMATETGTAEDRRNLAINYEKFGDLCKSQRFWKTALEHYEKNFKISKKLATEDPSQVNRRNLSISHCRLASVYLELGQYKQAEEHYGNALEIRKVLNVEKDTRDSRIDVAYIYDCLGYAYKVQKKYFSAKNCYEESLIIRKLLDDKSGMKPVCEALAECYENLGERNNKDKDYELSRKYYAKRLEMCKYLADVKGTAAARSSLSISYAELGDAYLCTDLYLLPENIEMARDCYQKAMDIRKAVLEETNTVYARRNVFMSYFKFGKLYNAQGMTYLAKECFEKALEIALAIVAETDTPDSKDDLGTTYYFLSFECTGELAKHYMQKAIDIYTFLAEAHPDVKKYTSYKKVMEEEMAKIN